MYKKIGCFVNTWIFGAAKIEDVLQRVAGMGYDGIELVGEPSIYDAKEIDKMIKDLGLRVNSICGMHPGPDQGDLRALCHHDAAERQKGLDYVKACIDLANGVGARSVLVVPSLVGRPAFFTSKEDDIKWAIDSLAKAGEYAEKEKVILTIEPINRYEVGLVNSTADALAMAKTVNNPYVRIMGDTFHMQIEEPDGIPNAIRRVGQYWFQHLHVADNTRVAPGRGTMPWKEIIRALMEIGYEGGISFEPLPKGAQPYDARDGKIPAEVLDEGLKFGLDFIRMMQDIVMKQAA